MDRKYTLDDVEMLRRKAGIGYEEAVRLLEKYDGDIAKALVELEKSGGMNSASASAQMSAERFGEWARTMWHRGLATRIIISRKDEQLLNLPVLIVLALVLLGRYAAVLAVVLMLACSCRVSVKRQGAAQADAGAEREPADEPDAGGAQEAAPEDDSQPEEPFEKITIE